MMIIVQDSLDSKVALVTRVKYRKSAWIKSRTANIPLACNLHFSKV